MILSLRKVVMSEKIIQDVASYYSQKLEDHGLTPRGVDWKDEESQFIRFEQLTRICRGDRHCSIIDVGCGYGAFRKFLDTQGFRVYLIGFDICESMICAAQSSFGDRTDCTFVSDVQDLPGADFATASGIFNVRLQHETSDWEKYVFSQLELLDRISSDGFAFNMLTKYSDPSKMRPDLFYADPGFYFDYCKTRFAPNVALLHDYGLWEFTILVRKTL